MRVLLDYRVTQGGAGRYGATLLDAITSLPDAPDIHVLRRSAHGPSRLLRAPFTPWGRAAVARAAVRWRADLVHGLHIETPPRLPSVVTIHDVIPLAYPASMPNPARRQIFRRILQSTLSRARRVIVPSNATASAVAGVGADASAIAVIPLGASPVFRPSMPDERDRARRRWASGRRYVAAVLTDKAHKNAHGFARAARLADRDVSFVAVYAGRRRDELASSLTLVEPLPDADLRDLYGGAEALVLPSFIEGFGLPALEALACSVPVICGSNVGVLPYIRPGVLEVDVDRPEEIAEAVASLLEDDALRARLSADGFEAAGRLTVEGAARATLRVYASALGRQ